MTLVITKDKQVRPLAVDGTELYQEAITRIRQLEQLNAQLSAQVGRMRPVVDAARGYKLGMSVALMQRLADAVAEYESAMAQLAKGGR